jgi:ribosomal protein S18 acetylase RimI-like enzyme
MDAADRPAVPALSEGFVLIDRTQRRGVPHPMRHRSGDSVAQRLEQCPLYDPALDLAIETADGRVAGYSLYWFDPTTKVGLVEPVRVEDEFQRQGLARAMLSAGLDRLVTRGAQRMKIAYETDAAAALYQDVGFRRTSTATWYRASSE